MEIKSGYGLDTENELKMLRVARRLDAEYETKIVTTFLGAHAVPVEYEGRQSDYVALVCEEMLPAVAEIEDSLCEGADALVIRDAKEIGPEHVRTLDEWRRRFWASIHRVRALGFDERFVRMWDFYLASCSAASTTRLHRPTLRNRKTITAGASCGPSSCSGVSPTRAPSS